MDKLFRAFDKAEHALIVKRDELFPAGTKVRSRLGTGFTGTVASGSLYPDQVIVNHGHTSWRYLERL